MKYPIWFVVALFISLGTGIAAGQSQPAVNEPDNHTGIPVQAGNEDWKIHSNWCANVDDGSSHRVYLASCQNGQHDQYDSVLACQRDAGKNNGDGGRAVGAIVTAGRPAVNAFMADKHPPECDRR
jgi:hypothetical protein